MSNKDIIKSIVELHGPLRTEEAEILGLKEGISGGSTGRYLRWLQESGEVRGVKYQGDKTKTWRIIRQPTQIGLFEGGGERNGRDKTVAN